MLTAEIAANACAASEVSSAAVGILATDVVAMSFQSDPSAVTGYGSGSADGLVIYGYPGTDVALFKVCNVTATAITPSRNDYQLAGGELMQFINVINKGFLLVVMPPSFLFWVVPPP